MLEKFFFFWFQPTVFTFLYSKQWPKSKLFFFKTYIFYYKKKVKHKTAHLKQ